MTKYKEWQCLKCHVWNEGDKDDPYIAVCSSCHYDNTGRTINLRGEE